MCIPVKGHFLPFCFHFDTLASAVYPHGTCVGRIQLFCRVMISFPICKGLSWDSIKVLSFRLFFTSRPIYRLLFADSDCFFPISFEWYDEKSINRFICILGPVPDNTLSALSSLTETSKTSCELHHGRSHERNFWLDAYCEFLAHWPSISSWSSTVVRSRSECKERSV